MNISTLTIKILLLSGGIALFPNCTNNYDESLDDLVWGIHFGMEKKAFFDHCWELNQEGSTHHGTKDNNVMYIDSLNFDPEVVINFYPKFEENKISKLPMSFYFRSWSPWNKNELPQDTLKMQVVRWMEKKYDTKFEEKQIGQKDKAYYKVLGPLTIRVFNDFDEMYVKADITHSGFQKK